MVRGTGFEPACPSSGRPARAGALQAPTSTISPPPDYRIELEQSCRDQNIQCVGSPTRVVGTVRSRTYDLPSVASPGDRRSPAGRSTVELLSPYRVGRTASWSTYPPISEWCLRYLMDNRAYLTIIHWSTGRDSNSEHPAWKADTLPIELPMHGYSENPGYDF